MIPYYLLFKTGDAEIRALQNCSKLDLITPVVELTKSRRTKKDSQGDVEKRLKSVAELFGNKTIILDVTTDENQSNDQTRDFFNFDNGFENWCKYLLSLKEKNIFHKIIPTILINTNDPDFDNNLAHEIKVLSNEFTTLAYRTPIRDNGYEDDIKMFVSSAKEGTSLKVIIDCEWLKFADEQEYSQNITHRIQVINSICENTPVEIIVAGTSFPNTVSDYSKNDDGEFSIKEILLFKNLFQNNKISYGDYGSVNPIRNDDIVMSRGWRPRIDVTVVSPNATPTIMFKRKKREKEKEYANIYTDVAKKWITDSSFPNHLKKNWGITQIQICAKGKAPGANPSFWISVRMSIFIDQILYFLQKLDKHTTGHT